jgi:L-fucose isomerase-like protein
MLDCFTSKKKLKIGFAPIRRTAHSPKPFNLTEAQNYKNIIESKTKEYDVEYVNLDFLNDEGLLFTNADAKTVAEKFIAEGVDGIFIPHVNFGCEEAAAKLCKLVGKPVLLWGPKDYINPDDLYRYRDSQCGLFATSKVLGMYGVEFSYIENCDIDDPIFDEGYRKFLSVVSVVKAFRSLRIGQISTRPGPFLSVKCNEMELLEKFGIEIVPITLMDLKRMIDVCKNVRHDEIMEKVKEMKVTFKINCVTEEQLISIAALKMTVEEWALNEDLSAVATQCWAPMIETIGITPCFALGEVCDDGLPFICEADIHGAITAVMAMAASRYTTPIFLADITIRHPENKNAELLWHCGVFAKELAKDKNDLTIGNHYNRLCPAVGEWELKGGDLSIVRFDGAKGNYSIFLGNAKGTEGPKTVGAYLWIEVDSWSKWEKKLIYGPYIHHCVGIYSDVVAILEEACRYIPNLTADLV